MIERNDLHDIRDTIITEMRGKFAETHALLDKINGRVMQHETDIAVIKAKGGGSAAAWGGGIGGVVVGILEGIRWIWTR